MPIVSNHGIVADVLELAMNTPDYEPNEPHTMLRDFLLDLGGIAWKIHHRRADRKQAFIEGRAEASGTPVGAHGAKGGK